METFPQVKFSAKVLKEEIVALGVKKITFQTRDFFSYAAGQYVWVDLSENDIIDPKGSRRAFSILNVPNEKNTVEIVARITDSGYKQTLFALKKGDDVTLHGPFGSSFTIDKASPPKKIIMVAGGVGVAAFFAALQTIKDQALPIACYLVYLNTEKKNTPLLKDLLALKRKNPLFQYKVKYEKFSWDDVEKQVAESNDTVDWWITGPESMIDPIVFELESGGVSRQSMVFENFYPSFKGALTIEAVHEQLKGNNLFAKAIQNSSNHTVITDPNGYVLFASKAAERITGYLEEEMFGNTPRLWGGLMKPEVYKAIWKQLLSGKPFVGEIANRRKNGEVYHTIAHISPIFNEKKALIGFIGTEEDITVLKQQEQMIAEKEQRLNYAINASRDGLWDWNVVTGGMYFSPRLKEIIGYADEEMPNLFSEWTKRIHPEDRLEVDEQITMLLKGSLAFYETTHRLLCKDGTYKWILDRGKIVERDTAGKPLRAVGTHTDITESKEREEELQRLNKLMVGRELKMIELKEELKKIKK